MEFKLPSLGSNVPSADITKILVKEGDTIAAETNVLELETEKAVVEIACPHAGKISKILVKQGQTVTTGTPLLEIEGAASAPAAAKPAAAPAPAAATPAPAAPPPASTPVPTPVAAPAPVAARAPAATTAVVSADLNGKNPVPAGPSTRRFARQLGVDLRLLKGSGPSGRITIPDVQAFVKTLTLGGGSVGSGAPLQSAPLPDFSEFGETERKALSKIGKTAANNLTIAWQTIPHVTQHESADITELEAKRKQFVAMAGDKAPKITMTVLAMKALVICMREFPLFNASFDSKSGEIVLKKYFNIGIAVDTEHGLVVPVIRDVDKKSIRALATEVTALAKKARDRKLDMSDFQGGCITISNLGGIGGSYFTPIVNAPEVAILGMSRSRQEYTMMPNGQPEFRLMLPLSLSYDHRVINGADAARFISRLIRAFSDPFELLVDT